MASKLLGEVVKIDGEIGRGGYNDKNQAHYNITFKNELQQWYIHISTIINET